MRLFFMVLLSLIVFKGVSQKQMKLPQYAVEHLMKEYPFIENNYRITHQHISSISKIHHIYLKQTRSNLDIVNVVYSMHFDSLGQIIKTNNELLPRLSTLTANENFIFDANKSLEEIIKNLSLNIVPINVSVQEENYTWINPNVNDTIRANRAYFVKDGVIKSAWEFFIPTNTAFFHILWDANENIELAKYNWTNSCEFHTNEGETHEQTMPSLVANSYNVYKLPLESPIHGNRSLQINPNNFVASPYGWHDTNGAIGPEFTTTKGNNVEAKDDITNDNETTAGAFANGGSNLEFDFPFDQNATAITNLNASLSNLFYWNNIIHDVIYQYGFNCPAGNFQSNNYGLGGVENDFVYADALDGSGTNNANFSTPVDGIKPRMQMYIWNKNTTTINSPASIAGPLGAVKASFGAQHFSITNNIVQADPVLACQSLNNAAAIAGKIALVDRGTCEFGAKCLNAQNAGAIAVIVCNNDGGAPFAMTGGTSGSSVTIPCMMASQAICNSIKVNLNNPFVNVTLTSKQLDSSFDDLVIAHEYAHGISNRLTGGAGNSDCLQNSEQMGEGWSDWYGLMLTMKPGHIGSLSRGVGNYLTTQDTLGNGIRKYKYNINLTINPHTYDSIKVSAVPHGVGSVWCAMLWEMTWSLIDKYGYDSNLYTGSGGNNVALKLVTEALKLQPCFPGFVDGRNAILVADQILYKGANQCLIWKAFAKRGLGYSANQGSSNSVSDGTQAFDLPPNCNDIVLTLTSNQLYAAPGDSVLYNIKVKNIHLNTANNVQLIDTLNANLQFLSASNGGSASGQVVNFPVFNLNGNDSTTRTIIAIVNPNMSIQNDSVSENLELSPYKYQATSTNTSSLWVVNSEMPHSPSLSWYAVDDATINHKYITTKEPFKLGANSHLKFWHWFDTELHWDGGQVFVSTDGKKSWKDMKNNFTQYGYNDYLYNLSSQSGFSGKSNGYKQSIINLSSYQDSNIYIRFALHCDAAVGDTGWYVDDIVLTQVRPTIHNKVSQSNSTYAPSYAEVQNPINIVPCTFVFNTQNSGQGSLRRAISCANNGDSVLVANELDNDTLQLFTNLIINKNITLMKQNNSNLFIKSTANDIGLTIKNNADVKLNYVHLWNNNPANFPTLHNELGTLTLTGGSYYKSLFSNSSAIRNTSNEIKIISQVKVGNK